MISLASSNMEDIAFFYIYSNLICFVILVIAYFCFNKNKNLTRREKVFSNILITHAIYFIFDSCWALLFYNIVDVSPIFLKLVRLIKYSLTTIGAYLWFSYISIYVHAKYMENEKIVYLSIPCILNIILIMILCLTIYKGEILQTLIVTFVPFCYMVFVAIYGTFRIVRHKSLINKRGALFYAIYPLSLIIFAVLQIAFENVPILCFGTSFVTIVILIYSLSIKVSTDALTGLYNRNELNRYVYNLVNNANNVCVLMCDLDDFKSINDTHGHLIGDKALVAASKILKEAIKETNLFLARFGGDEFIIIAKDFSQNDVEILIEDIDQRVNILNDSNSNYKIGISKGYAFLENNEDFLKAIERADRNLYINKKEKSSN